jgi:hypothetical protein
MKRILLVSAILTTSIFLQAQKETDHWFFGVTAGLDFTSGTPVAQTGAVYSIPEGCASISSPTGTLLFYTDGSQVWNANHQLMPNGTDLHGDISSSQSSIIVPSPSSSTQYYIFTTDADGDTAGFKYSMVDMTLHSGLGDITTKNVPIQDSVTEKLVAIRTTVGGSYWILTHKWNSDAFYAYELNGLGLQAPVISHTGIIHTDSVIQNTYGQMKFNMCGTKLAVAIGYMNTIQVFDFNINSGVVSNPLTLHMQDHVYGVEFSPNSDLLYISNYDVSGTLLQYNITLATMPLILASRTPLTLTADIYGLQMGSDGKIYCARSYGSQYAGVINSPNTVGFTCNYVENGVNLDTAFNGYSCALGLPGFMQTYLKNALNITCVSTAGIEESAMDGIGVYPNPSSEEFYLDLSDLSGTIEITVVDYTGKLIENKKLISEAYIFGRNYIPGIYLVTIRSGMGSRVLKLVKN